MKNLIIISCLLLSFSVATPSLQKVHAEEIYIDDSEDLVSLSENCSLDSYSKDKTFVLSRNISLEGIDFEPIPVFNGTLEGNGYTISGLEIVDSYFPTGFISVLGKNATISNLNIKGSVNPNGENNNVGGLVGENKGLIINCSFQGSIVGENNVGGIAGYNYLSGTVKGCSFTGEVIGENVVGGIVGRNDGLVFESLNKGKINTINVTPTMDLEDINSALTVDITKIPSFNSSSIEDIGGIAGYSTGYIQNCINKGDVGYQQVGYNIGGIVGRNSGHLSNDINYGAVKGRKDVGGIVGQMEPYINYNLSNDLLKELQKELNELNGMVDDTIDTAEAYNSTVSKDLENIDLLLEEALETTNSLINKTTSYGDDVIGEVNRGSEIVSQVISSLYDISNSFPTVYENIELGISSFEEGLIYIKEASKLGEESLGLLKTSFESLNDAISSIREGSLEVEKGVNKLRDSVVIEDKQVMDESLSIIKNGLSKSIESINVMSSSLEKITTVLKNAGWVDSALSETEALIKELKIMNKELNSIHTNVGVIKNNLDVDYEKIVKASDEVVVALDYFIEASDQLNDALILLESGINKISNGMNKLYESVIIEDEEALKEGIILLGEGFNELASATTSLSKGLNDLSSSLEGVDSLNSLISSFEDIALSLNKISASVQDASDAMNKISEGGNLVISNIKIDCDMSKEGASLVSGGFEDLSLSIGKLKECNASLGNGMNSLKESILLLKEGIDINDYEAIEKAIDLIYDSLGNILSSVDNLSSTFEEMISTMKDMKLWGEDLIDAFSEFGEGFSLLSESLGMIQEGVNALDDNTIISLENAEEGLDLIESGFNKLIESTYYMEDCVSNVIYTIENVEAISEEVNLGMDKLEEGFSYFEIAFKETNYILDDSIELIEYLNNVDPILVPTPSEEIKEEANDLYGTLIDLETQFKELNSNVTSYNEELISQIREINEKFTTLTNKIVDEIYSLNDADLVTDVSEDEILSSTNGKVFSCINNGTIEGDLNVGGIAGIMGMEEESDPEEDLSSDLSISQKKEYQIKAIIHNCKNNGTIVSKKDCVGGIVGKMDLGVIYECEAYGNISSTSGNYVGGISGLSASKIYNCYSKCLLSGNKYVGGIIGSGVVESYSDDTNKVSGCLSIVKIENASMYYGAIAGIYYGEFVENYYVSDSLKAINRVNYEGRAEQVSFENIFKRRNIPREITTFTLTFKADGQILKTVNFEYGSSFDESIYPLIPQKDGCYGVWENVKLNDLHFDTIVNVVYKPYTTTIESEKENNNKSLVLVEGMFKENEKVNMIEKNSTSAIYNSQDFLFFKENIKSVWKISLPDDGNEIHKMHFLTNNNPNEEFYQLIDGEWKLIEGEQIGSYKVFEVFGDEIELIVVSTTIKTSSFIIFGLLVVIFILLILFINKNKSNMEMKPIENDKELTKKRKMTRIFKTRKMIGINNIVCAILVAVCAFIRHGFDNLIDYASKIVGYGLKFLQGVVAGNVLYIAILVLIAIIGVFTIILIVLSIVKKQAHFWSPISIPVFVASICVTIVSPGVVMNITKFGENLVLGLRCLGTILFMIGVLLYAILSSVVIVRGENLRKTTLKEETSFAEELPKNKDGEVKTFLSNNENGNKVYSRRTFEDRLYEANPEILQMYSELKNEFLSYRKVRSRVSKSYESFRFKGNLIGKIVVSSKSLKVYLALDPLSVDSAIYHQRDASSKKKFVDVPLESRVKSQLSFRKTKKLIALAMEKVQTVKKTRYTPVDWTVEKMTNKKIRGSL